MKVSTLEMNDDGSQVIKTENDAPPTRRAPYFIFVVGARVELPSGACGNVKSVTDEFETGKVAPDFPQDRILSVTMDDGEVQVISANKCTPEGWRRAVEIANEVPANCYRRVSGDIPLCGGFFDTPMVLWNVKEDSFFRVPVRSHGEIVFYSKGEEAERFYFVKV